MKSPLPVVAVILALAATDASAQAGEPTPRLDSAALVALVDSVMRESIEARQIPGAVVTVVANGRVILLRGYGYANLEDRVPVDAERTVFRVGSVSKPITAFAALRLVEQGRLDLDADVNRYLEDFEVPATFAAPTTAAHLLTHRAGFDTHLNGTAARTEAEVRGLGEYLAAELPPRVRPPGDALAYSNHGYTLLGHLVETISGEPFADHVQRHVLEPLGMTRSGFRFTPEVARRAAIGYERDGDAFRRAPPVHPHIVPAASFSTTGADMGRFMLAMLGAREASAARRMMQGQRYTPDPRMPGVGYGLYESNFGGRRLLHHAGGIHGYMAAVYLWPGEGVGLFVANNGYRGDVITGLLFDFMNAAFPQAPRAAQSTSSPERSVQYEGSYRLANHPRTTLEKAGGIRNAPLRVSMMSDGALQVFGLRFIEVEPGFYREEGSDETLAFQRAANGDVRLITTYPWQGTEVWDRLEWWQTPAPSRFVLGFALIAGLIGIVNPLPDDASIRSIFQARPDSAPLRSSRVLIRIVAIVDLAVILLPVVGVRLAGAAGLQYGVPWPMDLSGLLAIGAALLLLPLAARAASAFRRGGEWTARQRTTLAALLVLQLLFVAVLTQWNLIAHQALSS